MQSKVSHRNINALQTNKPDEIIKAMTESESVRIDEKTKRFLGDFALSISENVRLLSNESEDDKKYNEWHVASVIAGYIYRFAISQNKSGLLQEAPPKPKKPPMQKETKIK